MSYKKIIREGFSLPAVARNAPVFDIVSAAISSVEEHLASSSRLRAYVDKLKKGACCPNSPSEEIVKYIARQKGDIDKSDPVLTLQFTRWSIMPVFRFERKVILALLRASGRKPSSSEMRLMQNSIRLAEAVDRLWVAWFKKVVIPYQTLDAAGKEQYRRFMAEMPQFDYTAFDYDPVHGFVNRKAWAVAFQDEVYDILRALERLRQTHGTELAAYFEALLDAYGCTDINRLEEEWSHVDEAWIRIPRTEMFVPVHGMENGYEHPFCVSPEFRLDVRSSRDESANLTSRRESILRCAADVGLSDELVRASRQRLEQIDIGSFVSAVRSGWCLEFRHAGQAVPNRQHVLAQGGKIFVDVSSLASAVQRHVEIIEKHCCAETAHTVVPCLTESTFSNATIMHEYSHPVGRTIESDRTIGEAMDLCEEAKASIFGIVADEYAHQDGEYRFGLVAFALARTLRFMKDASRLDKTVAPYVRENLIVATTLFDTGVIALSKKHGVVISPGLAKSPVWFGELRTFSLKVIEAYQKGDRAALERLVARYCDETHPQVAELIAWVNRA